MESAGPALLLLLALSSLPPVLSSSSSFLPFSPLSRRTLQQAQTNACPSSCSPISRSTFVPVVTVIITDTGFFPYAPDNDGTTWPYNSTLNSQESSANQYCFSFCSFYNTYYYVLGNASLYSFREGTSDNGGYSAGYYCGCFSDCSPGSVRPVTTDPKNPSPTWYTLAKVSGCTPLSAGAIAGIVIVVLLVVGAVVGLVLFLVYRRKKKASVEKAGGEGDVRQEVEQDDEESGALDFPHKPPTPHDDPPAHFTSPTASSTTSTSFSHNSGIRSKKGYV